MPITDRANEQECARAWIALMSSRERDSDSAIMEAYSQLKREVTIREERAEQAEAVGIAP